MTLNIFQKAAIYSSLIISSLGISSGLFAQASQGARTNIVNTEKVRFEEERRKNAMDAYTTLKLNVADSAGVPVQLSKGSEIQNAIRTIEQYIGEELYHKTSAGLQTYPSNGTGSISFNNGEYWVNTTQVGIGKFNGENYSYAKFKAEAPRDFSYTYTIFFNAAGYNGEIPENTDERARKIVSMNSGIPARLIEVKRESGAKIDDIVSIESGKSAGNLNGHSTTQGYVYPKHILFVPGQKAKFPLDNIVYIVDLAESIPVVQTTTMPGELVSSPEVKKDTVYVEVPCPEPNTNLTPEEIQKTYRFIPSLSMTNTQVPGFKVGVQVADKWDVEFGYEFVRTNDYPFYNFTVEEEDNPKILDRNGNPKYMGHSELTEKGLDNIRLDAISANIVRHFGRENQFGIAVGAVASIFSENYLGQEDRKTWILEKATGEKLSQDEIVTDALFNEKSFTVNPQAGLRGYFGRFAVGLDYIAELSKLNVKYNPEFKDLGMVRVSIGFNLGATKTDNQSTTSGQSVSYNYTGR